MNKKITYGPLALFLFLLLMLPVFAGGNQNQNYADTIVAGDPLTADDFSRLQSSEYIRTLQRVRNFSLNFEQALKFTDNDLATFIIPVESISESTPDGYLLDSDPDFARRDRRPHSKPAELGVQYLLYSEKDGEAETFIVHLEAANDAALRLSISDPLGSNTIRLSYDDLSLSKVELQGDVLNPSKEYQAKADYPLHPVAFNLPSRIWQFLSCVASSPALRFLGVSCGECVIGLVGLAYGARGAAATVTVPCRLCLSVAAPTFVGCWQRAGGSR